MAKHMAAATTFLHATRQVQTLSWAATRFSPRPLLSRDPVEPLLLNTPRGMTTSSFDANSRHPPRLARTSRPARAEPLGPPLKASAARYNPSALPRDQLLISPFCIGLVPRSSQHTPAPESPNSPNLSWSLHPAPSPHPCTVPPIASRLEPPSSTRSRAPHLPTR